VTEATAQAPKSPSTRGGGRAKLEAVAADPALSAIGLYALVSIGAAAAAYLTVFTVWAPYDDEGTLLVTLQSFTHGATLYRDVYTEYGPFYYEVFGGLFAALGHAVTTDLSRSIVIAVWVGTSLLFGLATQRLTGRLTLGVTGMIAAFATLYVLANEPMHPHGLCVLLLGAFTLLAVVGPTRRPVWAGGAGGALLAALLLTKINLGAYAIAAMALAAVITVEPLRRHRWLSSPVIAAAIALPIFMASRDLNLDWVREMVAVQALTITAVAVAAWPLGVRREGDDDAGTRWLLGAALGFAVAFVAILAAIVLTGPSLSDVYDGVVAEALRVRDVVVSQFPMSASAVDWAVAAVAGAILSVRLHSAGNGPPSIWPGLLRAGTGLTIWLTVARITPLSLIPSAGNPDSLPAVLAWVAVIPPAGICEIPYKRFLRVLLPALAVAETLQVYPVAGSQVGIASLTFVPVGALCLADALTSLRHWSAARGGKALERFGVVVAVALVALAVDFAGNAILRPLADNAIVYRHQRALPFAGATDLHLAEAEYETYTGLVGLLHRYRCSDFIGYPNVNSLYLWSGIEPPAPDAPGGWMEALDSERQQRIVNELRASPRPCAIRNDGLAGNWLGGDPVPNGPLVNYVLNDFHTVAESGEFQFMLPLEGGSRPHASG
jgi:hypothetical protein